ncbi:MAG: histidinol dehydrogenase [Candidatus Altiarchaeota archaeon]|nr:histidinol dehydrogenase [Candidatus Altiarchaeota archaeon]
MEIIKYGDKKAREAVERSEAGIEEALDAARRIIKDVREGGDAALIKYAKKFDGVDLPAGNIRVPAQEIKEAYSRVDEQVISALKHSAGNIEKYHREQHKKLKGSWSMETEKGVLITEKTRAIPSAGAYVPGGRAAYPSTVLMTCIPARIAGVKRIVVVSPPPIPAIVLVACDIAGVDEIYSVGGAQAVAALAYGTESIAPVEKIVGPGNKYVTAAKLLVFGKVDIDMPAGPSEILVIADSKADPRLIAADLLAQAEHDPDARCILATDSKELAGAVNEEIAWQTKGLKRKEIIEKSLDSSFIILVKDMKEAIELANRYAPEHLEIIADDAAELAEQIGSAGTIFLGPYSPVSAGDYASGENHVLPTGGAARFASSLGVRDFLRHYSIQEISKEGLSRIRETIKTLSLAESLDAHSSAVRKRFE